MQIIVIGCGKVGSSLAEILSADGHDIVIVDSDRNAFKLLGPDFGGITVTGVPIDQDVLKLAGIETCDALTAVTPDDNINIMACQVAREIFKVPRVIARIYNPERENVFHEFGLETICPTKMTVDVIKEQILSGEKRTEHIINNKSISFREVKVSHHEAGKKIEMVKVDKGSMIFGVLKKGTLKLASPEMALDSEDIMVIAEEIE